MIDYLELAESRLKQLRAAAGAPVEPAAAQITHCDTSDISDKTPADRPDWLAGHCVTHARLLSAPEYVAGACSWCPPDAPLPATPGAPMPGYGPDADGKTVRYRRCTNCGGHLQGSCERLGLCLRCDGRAHY